VPIACKFAINDILACMARFHGTAKFLRKAQESPDTPFTSQDCARIHNHLQADRGIGRESPPVAENFVPALGIEY
jgi:hypothetical protein